ncbi:hypothetical protein PEM37_04160 [Streptomyces sp. AD681]|uniref:hypothetical protein n=1 Tax=Streptomyces sp. AD681 TaxID=3019069 RepID=UPI0022F14BE6|nr:hypothetical protein [Streptomyces sp. AD681]MDA5140688.1 hypothetical protein [Streptomyces sp. AD681]
MRRGRAGFVRRAGLLRRAAGVEPGAHRHRRRLRLGVGCLLAAVVLALLPLPEGADRAQAAAPVETSAVTKSGTKGKYDDFSSLEVTVHQTRGLTWQGVKISWTGGRPAPKSGTKFNFLQIMQCWGDDPQQGPDRSQCEFGNEARVPPGGGRLVYPETDPEEAGADDTVPDDYGRPYVPFRPVTGDPTSSPYDSTYFGAGDTNSLAWLPNDGNGEGETVFELKSALEAEYLGCGARTTSDGKVRPCWLVVVPRGEHEPDGVSDPGRAVLTSALSTTNWDRRIVFPLAFEPVTQACDADKPERVITGSELATDAITSWQGELCRDATHRFTYTQSGEPAAREVLTSPGTSSAGMAMTVDPVRPPEGTSPVVHAPVAVSGLSIGFVWMYEKGSFNYRPLKDVRLNQRLLAKALTQSYGSSLVASQEALPEYLGENPRYLVGDPEFRKLNPGFEGQDRHSPIGMVVTSENTDSARMLWRYILADPDATKFLAGEKDPWGMRINPNYTEADIAWDDLDYFPKADLTATDVPCSPAGAAQSLKRTGLEVVPYALDMHETAVKVRRGDIGSVYECVVDLNTAKWSKVERPSPVDQRQLGVLDVVNAERYQLNSAALPNADGEYVKPTEASLLQAVARMPESAVAGVKTPDPARMTGDAYPLTAVVYAAARLDQAEDARRDYARVLRYAAGDGQKQGTASGELPYGYAPLPTALREQARTAAERLEKGVPAQDPRAPEAQGGSGAGAGGVGGSGDGPGGGAGAGGAAAGATGGGPSGTGAGGAADPDASAAARTANPTETDPAKQNVAKSGGITPAEALGIIRWVLLGVLIVGGVAGLAGPVMLRLSARRAAAGG